MSKQVITYEPEEWADIAGNEGIHMAESVDGEWVKLEDYNALLEKVRKM